MNNHKEASFFHRLLANTIDICLYLAINLYFINILVHSADIPSLVTNLILLFIVLFSPLGLLHIILFTQWFGGTLGKLLTGIKITSLDGSPLSFKRILFRQTIGYMFTTLLFGFGYLEIFKNDKRQAWHDQAVGSLVIKSGNYWLVGLFVLISMVSAIGYFGNQTVKAALANEPLKQSFINLYQKIQELNQGELRVSSIPNATVFIDDKEVGKTPYKNSELAVGDYKITLKSQEPNTTPWEGNIHIDKGLVTFVNRDLNTALVSGEVITIYPGKGLKITSNPSETEVELDGKNIGKTPITVEDASISDEHKIVLRKTGYISREIIVGVIENFQSHLNMDLGIDNKMSSPTTIAQTKIVSPKPVSAAEKAESIKYWQDELTYLNQESANLPNWVGSEKDQTKINRMIAIVNQQKSFASKALTKSQNNETFTEAEATEAKKYAQLTEEYNSLLTEVFPR